MIQLTIFSSADARIFDGPADNDLDAALIVLDLARGRLPKFKDRIIEMRNDPELTLAAVMTTDFISESFTIVTMNQLPHTISVRPAITIGDEIMEPLVTDPSGDPVDEDGGDQTNGSIEMNHSNLRRRLTEIIRLESKFDAAVKSGNAAIFIDTHRQLTDARLQLIDHLKQVTRVNRHIPSRPKFLERLNEEIHERNLER